MKIANPIRASVQFRPMIGSGRSVQLQRNFAWRSLIRSGFALLLFFAVTDPVGLQAQQANPAGAASSHKNEKVLVSDASEFNNGRIAAFSIKRIVLLPLRWGRSLVNSLFPRKINKSRRPVTDSSPSTKSSKVSIEGTAKNRVIYLHAPAALDGGALEVIQIELAGKAIAFGQPFEADENWLRELRIKFGNASSKPITYFDFGGGLIKGIDEELEMSESYQQAIAWNFGERSNPERGREKQNRIILRPGKVVDLTYENVASHYKGAGETGRGAFSKLVLGTTVIQFEDGTIDANGTINDVYKTKGTQIAEKVTGDVTELKLAEEGTVVRASEMKEELRQQNEIQTTITYCTPDIANHWKLANLTFNSLYSFRINEKGDVIEITKLRDNFIGEEAVRSCLAKWRIVGVSGKSPFVVYFNWKHGKGWGEQQVSGNGFTQIMNIRGGGELEITRNPKQ